MPDKPFAKKQRRRRSAKRTHHSRSVPAVSAGVGIDNPPKTAFRAPNMDRNSKPAPAESLLELPKEHPRKKVDIPCGQLLCQLPTIHQRPGPPPALTRFIRTGFPIPKVMVRNQPVILMLRAAQSRKKSSKSFSSPCPAIIRKAITETFTKVAAPKSIVPASSAIPAGRPPGGRWNNCSIPYPCLLNNRKNYDTIKNSLCKTLEKRRRP